MLFSLFSYHLRNNLGQNEVRDLAIKKTASICQLTVFPFVCIMLWCFLTIGIKYISEPKKFSQFHTLFLSFGHKDFSTLISNYKVFFNVLLVIQLFLTQCIFLQDLQDLHQNLLQNLHHFLLFYIWLWRPGRFSCQFPNLIREERCYRYNITPHHANFSWHNLCKKLVCTAV